MDKPLKLKIEYGYDPRGENFYWPEQESKRLEYWQAKRTRPAIAEAIYECNPGALEGNIFRGEDFVYFAPPKRLIDGYLANKEFLNKGFEIVQSWDTAFSAENTADYSVCMTALLLNVEGSEEEKLLGEESHTIIMILDVFREQVDFGALVPCALTLFKKWKPQTVLVEKRATGEPLIQLLSTAGVPVEGVNPGLKNKRLRAVQGLESGSAQGWMQQHRVQFPLEAPWLDELRKELINFTGVKDSFDDQVDAFVQLLNYAISAQSDVAIVANIPEAIHKETLNPLEALMEQFKASVDAYSNSNYFSCGNCVYFDPKSNFCNFHHRPTTFFDWCENFEDKGEKVK